MAILDLESEALLCLSQQASRPRIRRWMEAAGGALAAYRRHGQPPPWPQERLAAAGIRPVTILDEDYPELLRHIPDPPLALYSQGDLQSPSPKASVALVGARRGTSHGLQIAEALGRELAAQGVRVISGLAQGIDGAAHRGALSSGEPAATWAVLGGGLLQIYPRRHRALLQGILDAGGAALSEHAPDAPPRPSHFPERNRLISGLAQAVVVVEASLRSGSLITARMAGEQGRDLMAVPGLVGSPVSAGCHRLIKQGAALVECAEDVLAELGCDRAAKAPPAEPPPALAPVYRAVANQQGTAEEVAAQLGLPADAASAALVQLELDGFVQLTPGGYIPVPR